MATEGYYTQCPQCGNMHEVREASTQATRYQPSVFLNEYLLCPALGDSMSTFGMVSAQTADKRFAQVYQPSLNERWMA